MSDHDRKHWLPTFDEQDRRMLYDLHQHAIDTIARLTKLQASADKLQVGMTELLKAGTQASHISVALGAPAEKP